MNKINISIDDVSPHPQSSIKVLDRCFELINDFPYVKFTLFVPMAYTRMNDETYYVSEDIDFCNDLRGLPLSNFELGWHGYYHGIINISNNDEFQHLHYLQALEVLKKMFREAEKAGIRDLFKPILRPSAFRMSPWSFDACRDVGFEILALSAKDYVKECYEGKDEEFNGKVIYYNINPPLDPLNLYNNMEVVYHACEWDKNYLDAHKTEELRGFLNSNLSEFDFCFMKDM